MEFNTQPAQGDPAPQPTGMLEPIRSAAVTELANHARDLFARALTAIKGIPEETY